MKQLNNPFVVYGYKGARYFCDRVKETEIIVRGLSNERNITLMSPRRIGKTGLIHHVFDHIRSTHPDIPCIYVDLLATKNLDQFVALLAQNILGQLDTTSQSVLHHITEIFTSLRPTLSFDSITGVPLFSVDIAPGTGEQSLKQIFEYLQKSGKRCYIAFDEFQQITEYPEKGTEALLRSFIQFLPQVYFIFAGSQQHLMADMFLSAKRPFYQSSQLVELKEIDASVYRDFANSFFSEKGVELSAETFGYLYDKVDGQTWYIQAILNRVYTNLRKEISKEAIDDAIRELVEEQTTAFENYYASLTTNQAALLVSIAKERCVKSPMAHTFIRQYRLPAVSSIKMALKVLLYRQFIYQGSCGYVVYDRFFAMWLRQKTI